ncbi:MAG: AmmeMemoRadiSam system protein B [Candidatus Omnitrophica bacterium]|nr:AmmeMemoRadiSam system protein B [Candidatus Omnitrophota bacterium]MBU4478115.1 AmmeMemoRadiSam system protein B [Candidatus Omnitrophota bacterium]MCG2704034.1 AmmeMemoRadiSam system protein B [Candidatus Omnitrophota bacterium]
MIRKSVWAGAGKFYPDNPDTLNKYLGSVVSRAGKEKTDAKAVIMPHAGYVYSGAVAGKTISQVNVYDTVIILGPNHTGFGNPYSLMASGTWKTPLGEVNIAEELAGFLLRNSELIKNDELPHLQEHSIEVEVPFLQYLNKNISIVPLIIGDYISRNFESVADDIARAVVNYKKPVLIVASSDMTHYEPLESAKSKDKAAIEAILEMNPQKLLARIREHNITMCGFAPVAVALYAAKKLGAQQARLVDYQTSGDTTGDYSSVVGYAGMVIF